MYLLTLLLQVDGWKGGAEKIILDLEWTLSFVIDHIANKTTRTMLQIGQTWTGSAYFCFSLVDTYRVVYLVFGWKIKCHPWPRIISYTSWILKARKRRYLRIFIQYLCPLERKLIQIFLYFTLYNNNNFLCMNGTLSLLKMFCQFNVLCF